MVKRAEDEDSSAHELTHSEPGEEDEELDYMDFDPDTYSAAIVSLIEDTQRIATTTKAPWLRLSRIALQLLLLWVNIFIQAFLVINVKWFVTAKYVHDIRNAYDIYEREMYGGEVELSPNGEARGIGGEFGQHFHAENFNDLTAAEKEQVCAIPFSQPWFFKTVLLIWALNIVPELRTILDLFVRLIWNPDTVASMEHAIERIPGTAQHYVVHSLTRPVKLIIVVCMLLPRLVITLVLLWLGSRWLCATNNFEYLVLNSVALAFILGLPTLVYNAVVPARNKREVTYVKMDMQKESEEPAPRNFICPFAWGLLVCAWVQIYFECLQQVLPDYEFDVRDSCVQYIKERYAV